MVFPYITLMLDAMNFSISFKLYDKLWFSWPTLLSFVTLQLDQQCEDRTVLRYVYYYLARILSDSGSQGVSSGGGIPTPNWDALADIDAVGGVTRADVVPRIVDRLTSEALNEDVECKVYYYYSPF